jgi:hypothetical protein
MNASDADRRVRQQLRDELTHSHAHVGCERAFAGLPREHRGARVDGQPHTVWRLLEHLRIALWDILEFSRGPQHVSPKWPDGYWPEGDAPPNDAAWEAALAGLRRDLADFCALLDDPARDLHAPFAWGDGQTLMREALVIIDHNAYHVGQVVTLRQLLGSWPPA